MQRRTKVLYVYREVRHNSLCEQKSPPKFLHAEDDIIQLLRLMQVTHLRVLLKEKSKGPTYAEISDTVLAVQEISEVNSLKPQFYFINHIVGGHYYFYVYREVCQSSYVC